MTGLPGRAAAIIMTLLFAALALLPLMPDAIAGPYVIKFMTRVIALSIAVLSLDLLIGVTGLVSFGHATFFGLGAYAVYFVTPKFDPANLFVALAAAVSLAMLAALVIGAFTVRTRGFYFIMVTLAFGQMAFSLFHDTKIAGGSDGAALDAKPALVFGATTLLKLSDRTTLYYLALALLVAMYFAALWLVRSRFGRVLQAIRSNETRAQALGFDTFGFKLAIYTIAGGMAGLAGALFASIDGFIPPELLGWRESGLLIMMVVLGGVGTLHGALLGSIAYNVIEEVLKDPHFVGALAAERWPIGMGLILIAAVLAAPRGLAGWLQGARRATNVRLYQNERPPAPDHDARSPPRLEARNLTKIFGGLVAVDDVTLDFEPNRIHAIIGPNGAGKTTFTNVLTGILPASSGRILCDGEDITALPAFGKARRGIGRSFQRTNIFADFTVAENCLLAVQAHAPGLLARGRDNVREAAALAYAISATGLEERRDVIAGELSHGEQRQLEIAMLISSGARLLVLDEPLAGTGPEETRRVSSLLRELSSSHTIILIEHDMDAVFAIADTISVLVNGRLIASGDPAAIRADAAVREAYLGSFEPHKAQS